MAQPPKPMPDELEICHRVAELRSAARLSQKTLAEAIGITRVQLANIEIGRTLLPFWIGWRICKTLDLNPLYLATRHGAKKPFPRIIPGSEIKPTASFGAVCATTLKDVLTHMTLKRNNADVKTAMLPSLIERLNAVTQVRGKKSELAQFLEVPAARVSEWLAKRKEPGGETTLQLLAWVEAEEAKQKSPSGTSHTTGAQTRKRKSSDEKPDSSPPKP